MNNIKFENLEYLFPDKTSVNKNGKLEINNNDLAELVKEFGSPLYIYDEIQLEMLQKTILITSNHITKMFMFHIHLRHFQILSFPKF